MSQVIEAIGYIVLAVIVVILLWAFVPWITIGAINRLFDLNVDHGFFPYLYFWIIVLVFGGVRFSGD